MTDFKNRVLKPAAGTAGFGITTDGGLLVSGPDNITPQSTFEKFLQGCNDLTSSGSNHTIRYGGGAVYRQVQVTNFVSCAPQLNVSGPVSRNLSDLLNAGLNNFTIGNCNGIRIPGTPDNTHRNTRFSFYLAET